MAINPDTFDSQRALAEFKAGGVVSPDKYRSARNLTEIVEARLREKGVYIEKDGKKIFRAHLGLQRGESVFVWKITDSEVMKDQDGNIKPVGDLSQGFEVDGYRLIKDKEDVRVLISPLQSINLPRDFDPMQLLVVSSVISPKILNTTAEKIRIASDFSEAQYELIDAVVSTGRLELPSVYAERIWSRPIQL